MAEETIRDVDASGHWLGKTVTKVSESGRFWEDPAEHQDYFLRFRAIRRLQPPSLGAAGTRQTACRGLVKPPRRTGRHSDSRDTRVATRTWPLLLCAKSKSAPLAA